MALTIHINTPMLKEVLIEPVEQNWSLFDLLHFLNHKKSVKIDKDGYEFRYFDEDDQIEIRSVLDQTKLEKKQSSGEIEKDALQIAKEFEAVEKVVNSK